MNVCLSVKLMENNIVIFDSVLNGIFSANVIEYNDGIINIFNLDRLLLERRCDDYTLVFDFKKCVCKYCLPEGSFDIYFDLVDCKVLFREIYLKYKIADTGYIYDYSLKW